MSFFGNASLDSILKSFNIEIQKDIFPHSFVNQTNLNYKGVKPQIEYFQKSGGTQGCVDKEVEKKYQLIPNND
jgi:hypothetical protein